MKKIVLALCIAAAAGSAAIVTGVVRDNLGNPIPNAVVAIPALKIQKSADGAGIYALSGVPQGTYDVLFGASNYQTGYLHDVTFDGTAIENTEQVTYHMDLNMSGFGSSQQINFVIPDGNSAAVKINLYDLRGRIVSELVNGSLSTGFHSAVIPAGLACGIYAVQLSIGKTTLVRKIVIQ